MQNAPKVIIDCDFDTHHQDKHLVSMCSQLEHCLNRNKRSEQPLQIIVTGVSERFEAVLKKRNHSNWGVRFEKESDPLLVSELKDLIYLTGDSESDMGGYDVS